MRVPGAGPPDEALHQQGDGHRTKRVLMGDQPSRIGTVPTARPANHRFPTYMPARTPSAVP